MKYVVLLAVLQLLIMNAAQAQFFKIENRQYGSIPGGATALDPIFDELETQVNAEIADALSTSDTDRYLNGVSNAFSIANKGLGVDYGSDMKLFTVGVAIGAGADTGDQGLSDIVSGDIDTNKVNGIGAGAAVYAGLNLGILGFDLGPVKLSRMQAFVNFMTFEFDDLGEFKGKVKLSGIGAHLKYKLIKPIGVGLLAKWNGIDVTAGFDVTSLEFSGETTIDETVEDTIDLRFEGPAKVGVDVSTFSIPIEVSTGGQVLYFLGAYLGLAADINAGSSEPKGSIEGTISSPGNPGVSGDASFELSDEGEPDSAIRMFAGLEINAAVVKLFARVNKNLGGDAVGFTFGVSGGW